MKNIMFSELERNLKRKKEQPPNPNVHTTNISFFIQITPYIITSLNT